VFLVLAIALLLFLPGPWNVIAAVASGLLFVGELGFWQRRMRRQKVVTGVQTIIGATGEVTQPCLPLGQIRVGGELWSAHSAEGAQLGQTVRVVGVDGLTLEVEVVRNEQTGEG
jgi:membrane-bound serine protease (ClpP class)